MSVLWCVLKHACWVQKLSLISYFINWYDLDWLMCNPFLACIWKLCSMQLWNSIICDFFDIHNTWMHSRWSSSSLTGDWLVTVWSYFCFHTDSHTKQNLFWFSSFWKVSCQVLIICLIDQMIEMILWLNCSECFWNVKIHLYLYLQPTRPQHFGKLNVQFCF